MIEAIAGLAFALASGLLGLGGVALFWAAALAVALVTSLAIAALEAVAAAAWRWRS